MNEVVGLDCTSTDADLHCHGRHRDLRRCIGHRHRHASSRNDAFWLLRGRDVDRHPHGAGPRVRRYAADTGGSDQQDSASQEGCEVGPGRLPGQRTGRPRWHAAGRVHAEVRKPFQDRQDACDVLVERPAARTLRRRRSRSPSGRRSETHGAARRFRHLLRPIGAVAHRATARGRRRATGCRACARGRWRGRRGAPRARAARPRRGVQEGASLVDVQREHRDAPVEPLAILPARVREVSSPVGEVVGRNPRGAALRREYHSVYDHATACLRACRDGRPVRCRNGRWTHLGGHERRRGLIRGRDERPQRCRGCSRSRSPVRSRGHGTPR